MATEERGAMFFCMYKKKTSKKNPVLAVVSGLKMSEIIIMQTPSSVSPTTLFVLS